MPNIAQSVDISNKPVCSVVQVNGHMGIQKKENTFPFTQKNCLYLMTQHNEKNGTIMSCLKYKMIK